MPRVRRLRRARLGPGVPPRPRSAAREHRLRLRHRVLLAVPLLPRHLRHALDPRTCPLHRDRPGHLAARPVGVGRHGRWRRPLHRGQPSHPRPAPQRQHHDPALQQQDLRTDQGPVLPHLGARHDHQVHPDGLARYAVQPGVPGPGSRGELRRPDNGHRPGPPHRGAAPGGRAPRVGPGGDLPELPDLQRRRLPAHQGPGQPGRPPRSPRPRPADHGGWGERPSGPGPGEQRSRALRAAGGGGRLQGGRSRRDRPQPDGGLLALAAGRRHDDPRARRRLPQCRAADLRRPRPRPDRDRRRRRRPPRGRPLARRPAARAGHLGRDRRGRTRSSSVGG